MHAALFLSFLPCSLILRHDSHANLSLTTLSGGVMQGWVLPFKLFAYLVIVLLVLAMGYAAITAIRYWPAISV